MNYLHISKLTKKKSENDYYLGPWCFDINNIDDIDKSIVNGNLTSEEQKHIADYAYKVANKVIPIISVALNKQHGKNFSNIFWEILLKTWTTSSAEYLYFYYISLKKADMLNLSMNVDIDKKFEFSTMEKLRMSYNSQEYIHSVISFLIYNMNLKNIVFEERPLIKVRLRRKKKSLLKELAKKVILKLLNNKKSDILIYYGSPVFSSLSAMFKMRIFHNFAFSYKNTPNNSNAKRQKFETASVGDSEFEHILIRYIEQYIPKSLLNNFSPLLESSLDYKNKRVIVPSPGFYQDAQLIEIALAKEYNNAKIVFIQDGAYEMYSLIPESKIYYSICDKFLTWGYANHLGKQNIFISLCDFVNGNKYNSHRDTTNSILYQTRFTPVHGAPFFLQIPRDFKDYILKRVRFIKYMNRTKYRDNLVLKFKTKSDNNYDDKKIMDSFNVDYNLYADDNLQINNCKLLYVDYPSSALYIAIVCNTPFILSFDREMAKLAPDMDRHMKKLESLGLLYDNPVNAAERIDEIMQDIDTFWKNIDIQNMRNSFMKEFARQDSNCKDKVIQSLNNINMLQFRN